MSHSPIPPHGAGARAPDALSLLHQRLLLAEEDTAALVQDMGALGVSREQILGSAEKMGATQRPVSPLKMRRVPGWEEGMLWQQCDSLMSRVCRMESLLQTLKLTIFRLDTERELDPSHTAHLKQQLAALQQESEVEHQATRREAMKLRDQLQQAYQERDDARTEVQWLGETVEAATAAKMDVALAAEELKIVKVEISQKLMEMKEQMRQESARSAEAVASHGELLRRVEEMEGVVEMERRQALLLQSDCQSLREEVRTSRQRLEEEKDRGRRLEGYCQQLREQTAMKDSLVRELKTELKRQQTEHSKLLKEGRELRAAADRVQTLNKQLQSQYSQLTPALHSLTVENEKQQASLKAERSRAVKRLQEHDLLLEAARRDTQTELQVALTDKVSLQLELQKLKGEHAQLLQSSSIAKEMALTQRELLERTIERLRGELSTAQKEEEAMRKDLEGSKDKLCLVVTKLEGERRGLETRLSEAKREVGSLSSALQSQREENRRLMGKAAALDQMLKDLTEKSACEKGTLRISELEALQGACGPAGGVVGPALENIPASPAGLQRDRQSLQREQGGREQELATLKEDRLQAQREIRKHQAEVEKIQRLLTSIHSNNGRALDSLQKALETAKVDNKRLARSLEQAVLTNGKLHSKLEQARDQHQAAMTLRDEELREAWTKICHLSEELGAVKQQTSGDYESSMKTLHRKISELKMAVEDSSTGSGDLSEANQGLRQRVSELEWWVSRQKARIREQRSQLRRQQQQSRGLQDTSQKAERFEECIMDLRQEEQADRKLQQARKDSQQVLCKREAEWERWSATIQRWEARREPAPIAAGSKPARTQVH